MITQNLKSSQVLADLLAERIRYIAWLRDTDSYPSWQFKLANVSMHKYQHKIFPHAMNNLYTYQHKMHKYQHKIFPHAMNNLYAITGAKGFLNKE